MTAYASNPIQGNDPRSDQVVEYFPWIRPDEPTLRAICGRCDAVPRSWYMNFAWGDNPPTMSTADLSASPDLLPEEGNTVQLPREAWYYLFDNMCLTREFIHPFVPVGGISEMILLGPALRYTHCHWLSNFIGAYPGQEEPPGDFIPNIQWMLWYGANTDTSTLLHAQTMGADPVVTDAFVAANAKRAFEETYDSHILPTGNEFDQPMTWYGWVLTMVRAEIKRDPPPDGPDKIFFRIYAMYHLDRPAQPSGLTPMFACRDENIFSIVHNPLHLPPHKIHLRPY